MHHQPLSLRAQAVAWLSQREHSERELRHKLLRRLTHPRRTEPLPPASSDQGDTTSSHRGGRTSGSLAAAARRSDVAVAVDLAEAQGEVDAVIQWALERGYLDEARFVASRVHVRESKLGVNRIQHELAQHGLSLPAEAAQALRASELERATALWQRRFGQAPADRKEAAKQARFLVARGFSSDVVRVVLRADGRSGTLSPFAGAD